MQNHGILGKSPPAQGLPDGGIPGQRHCRHPQAEHTALPAADGTAPLRHHGDRDKIQGAERRVFLSARPQPHRDHQDKAQIPGEHCPQAQEEQAAVLNPDHQGKPFRHSWSAGHLLLSQGHLHPGGQPTAAGRHHAHPAEGLHQNPKGVWLPESPPDCGSPHLPDGGKGHDSCGNPAAHHGHGLLGQP